MLKAAALGKIGVFSVARGTREPRGGLDGLPALAEAPGRPGVIVDNSRGKGRQGRTGFNLEVRGAFLLGTQHRQARRGETGKGDGPSYAW